MSTAPAQALSRLNDAFRTAGPTAGDWMITSGVDALGPAFVLEAIGRVTRFDRFTPDNDPYGEHDFGSFEQAGQTLYWKIDYYATDLFHGSDDPADPTITRRVLTLMLASEY